MNRLVLLGVVVGEIVYLITGGLIFWTLESDREQEKKTAQRNFNFSDVLFNISVRYPCVPLDNLTYIANKILKISSDGLLESKPSNDWDIHGSIFFAMTVVTTIGYGNVTPKTIGGRLFCCFFAIIGIPFTMTMLVGIGEVLKNISGKINWKLGESRPKLHKLLHTIIITAIGFVLFLLIPAGIFVALEGWNYGTAVYYGLITATTVGFGDYVAAWNCIGDYCSIYRISVGVWIFLALAWLAGVIAAIQDGFQLLIAKSNEVSEELQLSAKTATEHVKQKFSGDDNKTDKHADNESVAEADAARNDVTAHVPLTSATAPKSVKNAVKIADIEV